MPYSTARTVSHTLVARLDSAGDVLLAGPAVRALAAQSTRVTMLVGPGGADVATLLPGVDNVVSWAAPWILSDAPRVDARSVDWLIRTVSTMRPDRAVIFTSFHQSPLPLALLLRLAGVSFIAADSTDYPGSLLDLRHARGDGRHEVEAMLDLAAAVGAPLPAGDDGRLRISPSAIDTGTLALSSPSYVVLHPGTSAPARAWPRCRWVELAQALIGRGRTVVVTGSPGDRAEVWGMPDEVVDLVGRTTWAGLAGVLAGADAVVVGNTGPAHLAAAVSVPVVSLFAPTVPAGRWAPYGTTVELLGDQAAACRDSRALRCPTPGHPCLSEVTALDVLAALRRLERRAA